jgi:hypothetical protein
MCACVPNDGHGILDQFSRRYLTLPIVPLCVLCLAFNKVNNMPLNVCTYSVGTRWELTGHFVLSHIHLQSMAHNLAS